MYVKQPKKLLILNILDILRKYTDEDHMLTTNQLIEMLKEKYGISVHRVTLAKDIAALQEFGIDIVVVHSTQSKYFVASRMFELPELKLLIDAVQSSKFITNKKSQVLIEKIQRMTSEGQAVKLKRNNYVVNRIKLCRSLFPSSVIWKCFTEWCTQKSKIFSFRK